MDLDKIKHSLIELKETLEKLLGNNFDTGKDEMYEIQSNLRMIIRRIYPNSQEVEKQFIGDKHFYWTGDEVSSEARQKWFIRDVKEFIVVIDTILKEEEIFDLENFKPLKEKVETEWQVGSNKVGFFRKKKIK